MSETLVTLFVAHLLGDFLFQTDWMVTQKKKFHVLLCHTAISAALAGLILGSLHWPIIGVTFSTHLAIDFTKVRLKDRMTWFIVDQLAHTIILATLVWFYGNAASTGWWANHLPEEFKPFWYATLSLVSGLVLIIPVGGIMVGKLTAPFTAEIERLLSSPGENQHKGLTNGGKFIGWLERALVLMLVLIGQPNGIGFLLAAKSILRFGEVKERKDRMFAEYVLIGTFLSFGWAMLIAVITQKAINHWLPMDLHTPK